MKYFIALSFMIVVAGCASSGPSNKALEQQKQPIYLDFTKLEDENTATYYLAYSIAKSTWKPTYLSDGSPDQLAREVYARTTMLKIWKESKLSEADKYHPTLDVMENILDAGFLREAIWVQHRDAIKSYPTGLDLEGFKAWIKSNPDQLAQAEDL